MDGVPGLDSTELSAFYERRNTAARPDMIRGQASHDYFPDYSTSIKQQLSKSLNGPSDSANMFGQSADTTSGSGLSKHQASQGSSSILKSSLLSDCDAEEGNGRERKRRDNINGKLLELLALIPPSYFEAKDDVLGNIIKAEKVGLEEAVLAALRTSGTKDGKPNKGQILTKLVAYLQDMQNQIDKYNRKEMELHNHLMSLELKLTGQALPSRSDLRHTTAEQALGEIGVGPMSRGYFIRALSESRSNA